MFRFYYYSKLVISFHGNVSVSLRDLCNSNARNVRYEILRLENLRNQNTFEVPFKNFVYNGTKPISYLDWKTKKLVPDNLKSITSLNKLKEQIKKCSNKENCPCSLCKTYIQQVGFIN